MAERQAAEHCEDVAAASWFREDKGTGDECRYCQGSRLLSLCDNAWGGSLQFPSHGGASASAERGGDSWSLWVFS